MHSEAAGMGSTVPPSRRGGVALPPRSPAGQNERNSADERRNSGGEPGLPDAGPEARVPESGEKRRVGDFIIKEFVNKFLQNSCKIKNSDKKSEKLFDILAKIDKECSIIENIK